MRARCEIRRRRDDRFPPRRPPSFFCLTPDANSRTSVFSSCVSARSWIPFPARSPDPQPHFAAGEDEARPAIRRRANPYAEVPSLYDLYTQISRRSPVLARFGEDIFRNGTGNFDELPMDLPVGPDYVLGPGDGLSIELWGGISEHLQRVVDREGRVALPEAGADTGDRTQSRRRPATGAERAARRISRRACRRFSGPAAHGAGLCGRGRAAARCL